MKVTRSVQFLLCVLLSVSLPSLATSSSAAPTTVTAFVQPGSEVMIEHPFRILGELRKVSILDQNATVNLEQRVARNWVAIRTGTAVSGRFTFLMDGARAAASTSFRVVVPPQNGFGKLTSPEFTVNIVTPPGFRDPPMNSSSPCQDVVFIGARGSGQSVTEARGLGWPVATAWLQYYDRTPGLKRGYFPIPYLALPADAAFLALDSSYKEMFFDSIDNGMSEVSRFLSARADCPEERYVLAGYSQGAMVIHRVARKIGELSESAETESLTTESRRGIQLYRRVDGFLAIADGDRLENQEGLNDGTAGLSGSGISSSVESLGITQDSYSDRRIPGWFPYSDATRFHSVCANNDMVCDTNWLSVPEGVAIHTSAYTTNSATELGGGDHVDVVRHAASDIANLSVSAHDSPIPTLSPPILSDASEGLPYKAELNSGNDIRGTWHLNLGELPLGLSLDPRAGQISGTPIGPPGTYQLDLTFIDRFGRQVEVASSLAVRGPICTDGEVPRAECQALRDIATLNPTSSLGWPGVNVDSPCTWAGVQCEGGHVSALYLSSRQIGELPSSIAALGHLKILDLQQNQLITVPKEVGSLASLTHLSLNTNRVTQLPEEVWGLTGLTSLDLNWNRLSEISPQVGNLQQLTRLALFGNQLHSFPPEAGRLRQLGTLDLRNNQLTSLPAELGGLSVIHDLYLGGNLLSGDVSPWAKPLSLQYPQGLSGSLLVDGNLCMTAGEDVALETWMRQHAVGWPSC